LTKDKFSLIDSSEANIDYQDKEAGDEAGVALSPSQATTKVAAAKKYRVDLKTTD